MVRIIIYVLYPMLLSNRLCFGMYPITKSEIEMAVYSQLVPRWELQVDMHFSHDFGTSAKQLVFHSHVAYAKDLQQIINVEDHQTETY